MIDLEEYIFEKLKLNKDIKLVKSDIDEIIDLINKIYYTGENFNIEKVSNKEIKITFSNKWTFDDVKLFRKLIKKDICKYKRDKDFIEDTFIFQNPLVLAVRIK